MYNNSLYPSFNQPSYNQPFPRANVLPAQQVIQVNGKASVDSIQLAPNSSVLLMDTSAPIVWLCVSDGVGRVSSVPYQITEYKKKTPENANLDVSERIKAIENKIAEMEARFHNEPDDADAKSK